MVSAVYKFVLSLRNGISVPLLVQPTSKGRIVTVSQKHFHTREAAVALLKMAKATSDPRVVAGLVEAAAALKDQAGELPPHVSETPAAAQMK